jgi:threonine synthase
MQASQHLSLSPLLRQYTSMSMLYHSTRGQAPELDFRGMTLAGLATDGGLYVPKVWPSFSPEAIMALKGKSYVDIAEHILHPFVTPALRDKDLRPLLTRAYAAFPDSAVTPLKQLDDRHWVLELFHGPTLAFKDIALQLLGHVFDYFLAQKSERIAIIGATSGDTGSAAMAALANRKNIDVFILYPAKGPSEIQRKQMTCIDAPNVHALAIEGSFDDCQAIVKNLFGNEGFRTKYNLAAVNSINGLRILAQIVYYFATAINTAAPRPVSFIVPTGNFGNIYAGYAAMKCGLPVSKLVAANNSNDILTRFFSSGRMKAEKVQSTLSPSMDIQISSNFERLLFDLCAGDGTQVNLYMSQMQAQREFTVTPLQLATARQVFTAARADDELTLKTIADVYKESGVILDPHSAVGIAASRLLARELPEPVICLATAHPAKFPETIRRAIGITPPLPESINSLLQKPERMTRLPAQAEAVQKFITEKVS